MDRSIRNRPAYLSWLLLLAAVLPLSACSLSKMASGAFADALSEGGDSYGSDNDIELVGQAIPFGLKTMEGLLDSHPQHRGLLLSLVRGFTQYSYVYVEWPANELEDRDIKAAYAMRERALKLYLRARDYGLRGLEATHQGLTDSIYKDARSAVADTVAEDVPLMYWTAAAWASAISLGKNNPALVADLPAIEALIYRAFELDEGYGQGAIHTFLISYEMGKQGYNELSVTQARNHLDRALALSDTPQAGPWVTWAEAVAIPGQKREHFTEALNKALAVDVETRNSNRLANLVMQRKARWLLEHVDYYFLE